MALNNDNKTRTVNLLKSLLHNLVVLIVGFVFAFLGTLVDSVFRINTIQSLYTIMPGLLFLAIGFLLRVWATIDFYEHHMSVISLEPQNTLITSGPFRFSRNPLYLGGNGFIFFGAVLFLGSVSGIFLTVINILLVDFMIRREEKQLEREFGEEWLNYKNQVRRWF